MINIATDCRQDLGPADWQVMTRWQLERFATEGSAEQKESLVGWAYSSLPYWFHEHLYYLATGQEWLQDD